MTRTTGGPTMSLLRCEEQLDATPPIARENSGASENGIDIKKFQGTPPRKFPVFFDPTPKPKRLRPSAALCTSPVDLLNKTARLASITQMQVFLCGMTWFEEFNAECRNIFTLGSGTYGRVYEACLWQSSKSISVKECKMAHYEEELLTAEEALEDKRGNLLDKLEPTVACFLTRHVLAQCPNFCAYYGYQVGKTSVLRAEKRLTRTERGKILLFGEAAGGSLEDHIPCMIGADQTGKAFSAVLQCLVATATLSRYGLSHNDLLSKNVLVSPCTGDLAYTFPGDLGGPGRASTLRLRTHGVFVQLCDFGLASQKEWLETYDGEEPVLTCDPRSAHWDLAGESLSDYYYGHTPLKVHTIMPAGMQLESCTKEVSFCHPLRYKYLKDNERDVASLLSEVLYHLAELHIQNATVRALRRYCRDALLELEKRRPATSDEFVEFIAHVVSVDFVSRYVDKSIVFVPEERKVPLQNRYALPTKRRAASARAELRDQLARQPLFDEMLTSDTVLQ